MKKFFSVFFAFLMIAGLMPFCIYASLPEGVPSTLEAASLEKAEVLNDEKGIPYFSIEIKFPQSFLDLNTENPADGLAWMEYYWKIDDGSWEMVYSGGIDGLINEDNAVAGKTNTYSDILNPVEEDSSKAIVIEDHKYSIKAQLYYKYYYGEENNEFDFLSSAFSNEVSVGSGSFYSESSDWAKPELQDAYDLGLIPDILIGADLTKPITREEFCELAVLLYEKVTDSRSDPVSPNPFSDTTNLQILKAFKLGITAGTSSTTFSPKVLINREQCAAMLFRAIKKINPDSDYSITGTKDFPDQKFISDWAVQATKYMSKIGIITGDTKGNFMPKATTTAQQAAGYGMATREQAIALSLRTYEKVG